MTWRWQAPVLSPISSRAIVRGLRAVFAGHAGDVDAAIAAICDRYSAADVLLTDSGTSALVLALRKLVPRGGTVALPAYACIDLTTAAQGAGVRVRLYDIEPATLSPDLESVRRVMRRGVDAVVVAHLYGYPADVFGVQKIAAEYGVHVIEDSAQGAGGSLCGRRLGALGDVAVLSFGRGKGMTAGSGGALLVKTPELSEWLGSVRAEIGGAARGGLELITLAAQYVLSHPQIYRLPASIPGLRLGEMVYHPPAEPRPMASAPSAVLLTALKLDPTEVERRRGRAKDLLEGIQGAGYVEPVRPVASGEAGYLRFAVLDARGSKSPIPTMGVVRGYPMTLDEHTQLRPLLHAGERAESGAAMLRKTLFTLPTHSRLSGDDVIQLKMWLGEHDNARVAIRDRGPLEVSPDSHVAFHGSS